MAVKSSNSRLNSKPGATEGLTRASDQVGLDHGEAPEQHRCYVCASALAAISAAHQEALLIQLQSAWESTFPARTPPKLN